MNVTPVKKKFGKYAPGDVFELKDKSAEMLIKVGVLREVEKPTQAAVTYATRMLQAEGVLQASIHAEAAKADDDPAPYGYKADGTPRQRPGRPAKSE